MKRALLVGCALMFFAASVQAQNEATLRAALEGKMITLKVDMPATSRGIDLYPGQATPVDWRDIADRTKDNGTALRVGQTAMITKVAVKGDSHIEVQLGGGGYGTFGDNVTNSSSVSATTASESKLELSLRDSVRTATSTAKKRQFEKELSSARTARERENTIAKAEAAQANEAREANLRAKRSEAGSRFNIRYKAGIPAYALTPEGVMSSLAAYVDFPGHNVVASTALTTADLKGETSKPATNGLLALKKGLSIAEVEALLGPAKTAAESKEGVLTVVTRSYVADGKKIVTSFVNGVLIDYSIVPI